MATVEFEAVRKAFGATEVIHDANLKIADGEFVVLVGPSGCGKSTLLRLVAGVLPRPAKIHLFDAASGQRIG